MATTINVTSSYSGALAGDIFVQAFKAADTLNKGAITVMPNVVGSGFLPKLTYSDSLSIASCGWEPTGTIGLDEKEIAVKKYSFQGEICKTDFESTYTAQASGIVRSRGELPATLQEAILKGLIDNMGALIDAQIWQGNNSTNQFNGLLPQMVADADVIDVTGAVITKANVEAELEKVYTAIPDILDTEDEDLIIVVANNVAKAYKQAQAAMGMNTTVGNKELDYLGVRMESLRGLPSNSILAYRVKNLGFLTALESELNEVRLADDETRLDNIVRYRMDFTAGVGYSFGGEIVYSRPA